MTTLSVRLPMKEWTLDDVAELAQEDPDHRYELQGGSLLIMPPADLEHNKLIMKLGVWLSMNGYADRVAATPGVKVGGASGRSPDVIITQGSETGREVWLDPTNVLLAIEIVSPGSKSADRHLKPVEYAEAGIPHFWLVERDGPATVHMFELDGEAYVARRVVPLSELLAESAPGFAA